MDTSARDAFRGETSFVHAQTVSLDFTRPPSGKESDYKLPSLSKNEKEGFRAKDGASSKRKNNDNSTFLPLWN